MGFECFFKAIKDKVMGILEETKEIAQDDPRRILHSLKVGLAITLLSLLYYVRPLYGGFGQAGMSAILTVVAVFEFTIGETISKSSNQGGATLLAGALGIGADYLANLCGVKGEPFALGFLVFILGAVATFTPFFPNVKSRYDCGVTTFIVTFILVAVSGFRVTEILQMAHQKLSTLLIGAATCMMISITVYPVWAGQDLHYLVAENIQELANFLEGLGREFCTSTEDQSSKVSSKDDKDKSYLQSHKSVLNSKPIEESLAGFGWWEPRHGCFRFRHPWELYLSTGDLARECASQIDTLSGCMISSKLQASELLQKIQPACKNISIESGKALKEIASAMKNKKFTLSVAEIHIHNSKASADELRNILENSSFPINTHLQEIMPLLLIASLLTDITEFVEKISNSVNLLSPKAGFHKPKSTDKQQELSHPEIVKHINDHVVMDIVPDSPENENHLPSNTGQEQQLIHPQIVKSNPVVVQINIMQIVVHSPDNKNPLP